MGALMRPGKSRFIAAVADAAAAAGFRVHRPKASDPIGGIIGTNPPVIDDFAPELKLCLLCGLMVPQPCVPAKP